VTAQVQAEAVDSVTLLADAANALMSFALRALAAKPSIDRPYPDCPDLTPWTHTIGPEARRAHDLSIAIRRHLGEPGKMAVRAIGSPPLEMERVVAAEVAACREQVKQLADSVGATYRTGVNGQYQCAPNCPQAGFANPVNGHGSHLHPFAELVGREQ